VKAKFNFYSITEFGFYKRKKELPEFGELKEFLDDFSGWLKLQRSIENTLVENKSHSSKVNGNLYCEDFYECTKTNSYLITLWNEVSNDEGNVFAMSKSNKIGEGKISSKLGGNNEIIGLPSYYWILPDENLLVTVKFSFSYQAAHAIESYFKSYANSSSGFINHQNDKTAIGFTNGQKRASWFRFSFERLANKNEREKLLKNPEKVTALVRRFSIGKTATDERSKALRAMLDFRSKVSQLVTNGWVNKKDDQRGFTNRIDKVVKNAENYRVELETPFVAEEEVLEFMVNEFDKNFDESKWEKVGFKMKNSGMIWLGNTVIKCEKDLDISRSKDQLPTAVEITSAINKRREAILAALDKESSEKLAKTS